MRQIGIIEDWNSPGFVFRVWTECSGYPDESMLEYFVEDMLNDGYNPKPKRGEILDTDYVSDVVVFKRYGMDPDFYYGAEARRMIHG